MTGKGALLEVENLVVELRTPRGPANALRDVSFSLEKGETLGLIGESGSGKSLTALAIMGLLPETARVSGAIRLEGVELLSMEDDALCRLRGNRMAMIFQEPMSALNPLHPIGRQVAEPLRIHRGLRAAEARHEAARLLDRVGIAQAASKLDAYPHQLSGGQRQRVTIAMALACKPALLIADEPTTALDVTVQAQVLDLIQELVEEADMALLLVSHDLGVIAENAARMMVMYGGTLVESGPTADVFGHLAHPYSRGLFSARPGMAKPPGSRRGARLPTIAGRVPDLIDMPVGCPFATRCPLVLDACRAAPPEPVTMGPGHVARCLRAGERLALS